MGRLKDLLKVGRNTLPRADRRAGDQRTSSDAALSALRSPSDSDPPNPTTSDPSPPLLDGIKVWHDCPDATIDICFVHGLTGNRESTWTASKQSTPWPTILLPPKLPRARLLTWGYDAYVVQASVASKNRLADHAINLLIDLTNDRASCDASGRPLIFVAHSLGGLVCKEAILWSRNNPEPHLCDVFEHTTGIIFMGTPHRGSWMADWMKIPASGLGVLKSTSKSLLQVLGTDDQLLESIQVKFWSMVRGRRESGRRLEVSCFFEELPLPVVGQIVSKESATLEGYTSVSVHANHRDMVKFRTENDNGFKCLVGDLVRWEGETRSASREVPAAGIGETGNVEHATAPSAGGIQLLRPATRNNFEIAIICALPIEADTAGALFDYHWDDGGPPYDKFPGDPNAYSTGAIGRHNVVMAHMPGMGTVNAALVASNCKSSFPNIKLALVVGICGAIPVRPDGTEIVLGDVIISNGVMQYDFGRQLPDQFIHKDTLLDSLGRPNIEIRAVLAKLSGIRGRKMLQNRMALHLTVLQAEPDLAAKYPGAALDTLFEAKYRHVGDKRSCAEVGCNGTKLSRERLQQDSECQAKVHFGLIVSGNKVMKSGEDRDVVATKEGVIAFEMESAGVWDIFPCIVIKGVCDYADSHKSKGWQRYAAATAAACMKAFLEDWVPSLSTGQVMLARREALAAGIEGAYSNAIYRPCYYLSFRKNRQFVGRATVLEALEKKLFTEQSEMVALVGLGGIGKTQVALQFAYSVKANRREYSIFWVVALSEASFEKAYAELAQELGVKKSKEDEDVKDLVRCHLCSEKAGKWLLIVDNADDIEMVIGSNEKHGIYRYLPKSESGRVVFTTRSREVAVAVAGSDIIDLQEMTQKEATAFLETSLTRKELLQDKATTVELLRELTYLPLAIAQAVAYLNQNQISARKYLGLLRGTEQSKVSLLSRGFHDRTRYEGLQNAVATTWLVSFAQIQRSDKAAASILGFVSCIEPKAIPRSILPEVEPEEEMEHAIGTLRGYAFLSQRGDEEMFDMHSLVHVATRVWLESEGLIEQTTIDAIRHIEKAFPPRDRTRREKWRGYVPHGLRVLNRSSWCQIAERYNLFMTVGFCLDQDRRFKEAVRCFEAASEWRREHLTEDDIPRLTSEHALARAYLDDRRIKEAIEIFEHVVAVRKRTLVDEDHARLVSEHELARAYLANRQIKEAIEILEHVVEVEKRTLVDEDHARLVSEHELARAYLDDRRIKEAIEILEHVVAVWKRTLADEDHDRLTSEHELARAYLDNRRVKEAIEILEHVVVVRKRTLVDEDYARLTSEHELARAYLANRQIKEAIEILEHVVAVWKRTLVDEDYDRLASEHELARAYLDDRRIKEAIEILEHVVVVWKRTLVDEDHDRLASEHELARAYLANRQIKEAIEILEHVVVVRKRTLADEDHARLASEHGLAMAYLDDEMVEEAIQLLEHVVAVEEDLFEEDDPDRLVSLDLLTDAYTRLESGFGPD